jgi:hypothetical protein
VTKAVEAYGAFEISVMNTSDSKNREISLPVGQLLSFQNLCCTELEKFQFLFPFGKFLKKVEYFRIQVFWGVMLCVCVCVARPFKEA